MNNTYPASVGSIDPIASMSDVELIETFLRGRQGQTRAERAAELMHYTGSLRGVFSTSLIDEGKLTQGEATALRAALEIATRYTLEEIKMSDPMTSPQDVRRYLSLKLSHLHHEEFGAMFLDNRHRVLHYATLFKGTIDSAAVYPREVVRSCLSLNAAAVIFAHNHPSGVAEPSDTDVRLTRKLVDSLALIDVRVLDHHIIGKGTTTSLAERGLM